ncbi:MAG: tetratricopeptide repeat protein [Prevotella sp.]|jgi:hypothetical protein|nr:tetratricopeptide repeat protein [Prevotella sp.]
MKRLSISMLFVMLLASTVFSQTLNEAKDMYRNGEYAKALPVFEKEYLAKPTDPSLNQWYGVCLYETGGNPKTAEKCLALAASKGIPDASLYLGKIYTRSYRLLQAEVELDKYVKVKKRDKAALVLAEKEKALLAKLKKAALHCEDVQIIDSVVVDKNSFLAAYKLGSNAGALEKQSDATAYMNEKATKIYYARPDENGLARLFSKEKLMENYENEKPLSDSNFGMSGNLNYPFVLTDGLTLYFASDDKNGLGGYDLYVTRYNTNNNAYLAPEHLNMPFNSLFNDYMLAIDDEKGVGWFASDRFQPEGKVCIYTFIPNSQVVMLESGDDKYLIRRAVIASIKDSWKPEADYSSIIRLARSDVKGQAETVQYFAFVINDEQTCYKWSDFKNPLAKESYRQANEAAKMLKSLDERLDALRDSYAGQPSQAKANEILELESRQSALFQKINDLELRTRSLEISRQ